LLGDRRKMLSAIREPASDTPPGVSPLFGRLLRERSDRNPRTDDAVTTSMSDAAATTRTTPEWQSGRAGGLAAKLEKPSDPIVGNSQTRRPRVKRFIRASIVLPVEAKRTLGCPVGTEIDLKSRAALPSN
jgi:hypothetical protein